jgi:hypothetical protein
MSPGLSHPEWWCPDNRLYGESSILSCYYDLRTDIGVRILMQVVFII